MRQRSRFPLWRYRRLAFTDIRESSDKDILLLLDMIWYAGLFFSTLSKWSFIRNLINMLSWLSGMRDSHFIFKHFYKIDGKIVFQQMTEMQGRHSERRPIKSSLTILFFSNTPPNTHTHTCTYTHKYTCKYILTQWFTTLTHNLHEWAHTQCT